MRGDLVYFKDQIPGRYIQFLVEVAGVSWYCVVPYPSTKFTDLTIFLNVTKNFLWSMRNWKVLRRILYSSQLEQCVLQQVGRTLIQTLQTRRFPDFLFTFPTKIVSESFSLQETGWLERSLFASLLSIVSSASMWKGEGLKFCFT